MGRNGRFQGAWVWLFPLAQTVHVAEEYAEGYGFHRWLAGLERAPFSLPRVLAMHLAFVMAMAVASLLATRLPGWGWVVPGLATLVLLNALAHFIGRMLSDEASSGLVSSIVLWVPLGVTGLARAWRRLDRLTFWGGVVAGAVTQAPVTWVALRASRL